MIYKIRLTWIKEFGEFLKEYEGKGIGWKKSSWTEAKHIFTLSFLFLSGLFYEKSVEKAKTIGCAVSDFPQPYNNNLLYCPFFGINLFWFMLTVVTINVKDLFDLLLKRIRVKKSHFILYNAINQRCVHLDQLIWINWSLTFFPALIFALLGNFNLLNQDKIKLCF